MGRARWLPVALCLSLACQRGSPGPVASAAGAAPSAEEEGERQRLVRAELARYDVYPVSFDASGLSEEDRALLRALVRAGGLIEELNMLQANPSNLEWLARVRQHGSDDDRELFRRYQVPWCHDDESPLCVALAGIPARQVGAYAWPEGMTDEDFAAISSAPESRELQSPFTVVRRAEGGRFAATAYSQTELLGPRMAAVADALREAADHADTES
jgi:hypothetical protein